MSKGDQFVGVPAVGEARAGGADCAPTLDGGGVAPPLAGLSTVLPNRYVDQGVIGTGGMGEVHRVHDRVLNRSLAMKVMRGEIASSEAARGRFLREAQITAGLQHPGIVAVHDQGELVDGRLWYTMREVRGQTLAALDERTLRRRIEVLVRVAQAVGYAHRQGVIHRDLKPSNVMVGPFGEVLVLDWGLARRVEEGVVDTDLLGPRAPARVPRTASAFQAGEGTRGPSGTPDATRLGAVMGTPEYMSPEQAAGEAVGPPTDVFALGAVLRDVLTSAEGTRPPSGGSRPRREAEETAPAELWEVCHRAMAVDIAARFSDAVPLADALLAWLDGARRRAEAQVVLDEARGLLAPLAAARAEVEALNRQAEVILAPLPPHAPVEQKLPGWRLEDEAEAKARAVRLMEIELVQKARAALERADDFAEAHALLADLYQQRAAEAEARRDADAAAEYHALLRVHDRGQHAAWMAGTGRFTLHTDPPGAALTLYRIVQEDRRLVPRHPVALGVSPVVDLPLEPGSYEVRIEAEGRVLVVLPVFIERRTDWMAGPPGDPHRPVWLPETLGPDEVYVPAGWFISGGDPQAIDGFPRRRLWVDGFVMMRFPVTHREYIAFLEDLEPAEALRYMPCEEAGMTDTPRPLYSIAPDGRFEPTPDETLDHPVWGVTWYQACGFAAWRSRQTARVWRLPHEQEWEKAARGADGRFFPWGDRFEPTWACTLDSQRGPPKRAGVRAFPEDTSPYGIRGLAGNVRDWCLNVFTKQAPENGPTATIDLSPMADDTFRLVRGGSMASRSELCRSSSRFGARAGERRSALGFRLVLR